MSRHQRAARRLVSILIIASLGSSLLLTGLWLARVDGENRFEPAVTGLGNLAALLGLLVERVLTRRDRRRDALAQIAEELKDAAVILRDKRFGDLPPVTMIFPRIPVQRVADLLALGLLKGKDDDLAERLRHWLHLAQEVNHRLDLTEVWVVTGDQDVTDLREMHGRMRRRGGKLQQLRSCLAELQQDPRLGPPAISLAYAPPR